MVNHVKMMPIWHFLDEHDASKGFFSGFPFGSHSMGFYGDEFKHP